MTDHLLEGQAVLAPRKKTSWLQRGILGAVCALVIGLYAYTARTGPMDVSSRNVAADSLYNLLVQGFRDGQLSLKKEVPPGFAQLPDPFDPIANANYRYLPDRLHDLSYYKGRLYLYFGPPPALLLFWPYVGLTGQYLAQCKGVMFFCALGFLISVGLLLALWRRYFPAIGFGVVIACALALGLGTGTLIMMARRAEVYEVAISCGYFLTMLALAALWKAIHEPGRRGGWLALASLVYGLAVAARPNLLFGAVILLVPIRLAWRERRPLGVLLLAAIGPIFFVGLGLMLYNYRRFDNPLEFGLSYQLAGAAPGTLPIFSPRFFWLNFRVYFLEPVRWNLHFPFAHESAAVRVPIGHPQVEIPYGILTNFPFVLLALAVPLAWRSQSTDCRRPLTAFLAVAATYVWICAVTLVFFNTANFRYAIDFLPALITLAVVGVFGLEQALADRPNRRRLARWGWGGLLFFSVAINLLASIEQSARTENDVGGVMAQVGRWPDAIDHYKRALWTMPYFAEPHYNLGIAWMHEGQPQEATEQWEEALRIKPDYAKAHNNLGIIMLQAGRYQEAIDHFEQALQSDPHLVAAYLNLGNAFERTGQTQEAIQQYETALQLKPDFADAQQNLNRLRSRR